VKAPPASTVGPVLSVWGELRSSKPGAEAPGDPLAAVRTEELERALAEPGITEHVWLDYRDVGRADVEDDEAVARIRQVV
jgi:LmbE family N-acetylglucosaminyl deacetylase